MPKSLEDRVRELERFRYSTIGRINACQTLLFDIWLNFLDKSAVADPAATAERMREQWLKNAGSNPRSFPGVDPAHLDVVSQEYREALEDVTAELVRLAKKRAPRAAKKK